MNYVKKQNISNKNLISNNIESNKLLIVDSILQKWYKLQKIIKEELILREVILKQQKIDFNQLKDYFIQYYNMKLKLRQEYEDIDNLKNSQKKYKKNIF